MSTRRTPQSRSLRLSSLFGWIITGFHGRAPNPPSGPSKRPPRWLRGIVASVAVLSLVLTLSAQGGADGGSNTKDTKSKSVDKDAPPNAIKGDGGLVPLKLPDGKTIMVAAGITAVGVEGGLFGIAIARGVPVSEAAFAIIRMNANMVGKSFRVIWTIGKTTTRYVMNAGGLVARAGARTAAAARALKPLAIPLTVLFVWAYEHAKEREQLIEVGHLLVTTSDTDDTCLIRFVPAGGDEYTHRVMRDHKACRGTTKPGTSSPSMYMKYGSSDKRRAVYDFVYPQKLVLKRVDSEKIKIGRNDVPGRKCTLYFASDTKLKLESVIVSGSGKNARVTDPCAIYVGHEGDTMYAGETVLGLKIFRSDAAKKGDLLHEAQVSGTLTTRNGPAGSACQAVVDPIVDHGESRLTKRAGKYVFNVPNKGTNVGLCVDGNVRFVRLKVTFSGLNVWMQTSPPGEPVSENHYKLKTRDYRLAA